MKNPAAPFFTMSSPRKKMPLSLALSPLRGEREGSLSSLGGEGRGEEALN
jgi:hypothetical protein